MQGTDGDARVWELHEVEKWHEAELAKPDKWGKPYGDSDQLLGFISSGAASLRTYKQWQYDLRFVGLGIICASAASIWSVWF
ncbi:hypothetical protein V3C41_01775 [Paenarthrobacter nicotinovorans]|uniref:Uncharacterized protein n=1 Tax=Paenarthrobacter nicotinovorans TaxID=29320 RepID=A0ABV0GMN2_PAENI